MVELTGSILEKLGGRWGQLMGARWTEMMQLMVSHLSGSWERQGAGVEAFRMALFHPLSRRF